MITGQNEDVLRKQAHDLGADDYVTKPFTAQYLTGEVMEKLQAYLLLELRATSDYLTIEREKVEVLFKQVQDGVLLLYRQGKVFSANPMARQLLDLPEEIPTLGIRQVMKAFQFESHTPGVALENPLEKLDAQSTVSFTLLRENPKRLALYCQLSPISNQHNEIFGYMLVLHDGTSERLAETAHNRFLALINHKLHTPLQAIMTFPKLYLKGMFGPPDSKGKDFAEASARQSTALQNLIDEVIALTNIDPAMINRELLTVEKLVSQAKVLLPLPMKESGKVELDSSAGQMKFHGGTTLMTYAFRDLIENAFKFNGSSSTTVPRVDITGKEDEDFITLVFADNGPGIPAEDRERVFRRFYQVEKNVTAGQVPGAGLGLAMVKETIDAHGGRIWIEANGGASGTRFVISLPKASPAPRSV